MSRKIVRAAAVVLVLIVLIGVAVLAYYYGRVVPLIRAGRQQGIYQEQSMRASVADFGFKTEDGTFQSIADLKGNVVVVDVWATWCGTCIFSIPQVVALQDKYRHQPVKIIGLNVDNEGWKKIKPFQRKHPEINYLIAVPFPEPSFLIQSLVDLSPLGKVSAIPTVFIADRQGRLAGKFIETGHGQEIDDLISRLLAEQPSS